MNNVYAWKIIIGACKAEAKAWRTCAYRLKLDNDLLRGTIARLTRRQPPRRKLAKVGLTATDINRETGVITLSHRGPNKRKRRAKK